MTNGTDLGTHAMREITYISPPRTVSMADHWFDIASIDHFWIRRRFHVFCQLAHEDVISAQQIAEFGCGHGLLQRQIEDRFRKEVLGFDLNESALKRNVNSFSRLYCYDVYQEDVSLRERFDLILLFDVLEHIDDDARFLLAIAFHLSLHGRIVLNVPAGQWAFSSYDRAAGHVRRYSMTLLRKAAFLAGLRVIKWTYWGLPLLPALAVRKALLARKRNTDEIISAGFDSKIGPVNWLMGLVSKFEPIPQKLCGTSLMVILQRKEQPR